MPPQATHVARCHAGPCSWGLSHYEAVIYGEAAAHTEHCDGPVIVLDADRILVYHATRTDVYRQTRVTPRRDWVP